MTGLKKQTQFIPLGLVGVLACFESFNSTKVDILAGSLGFVVGARYCGLFALFISVPDYFFWVFLH